MYNDELPETEMKWILYGACVVKTNFVEEEYNTKKKNKKQKYKQKKNKTLWLFLHVCLIVFILKKSHQLYYH